MKALVLDFDGVISDSAREALVIACSTYLAFRQDSPLIDLDPRDVRQRFMAALPLAARAEDYAVLLTALELGLTLDSQAEFDALKDSQPRTFLDGYHEHFYETRHAYASSEPENWRALMKPYPEVVEVLERHAGTVPLAIATAKDGETVHRLLEDYGLAELFPPERVLDKSSGRSKTSHLEVLQSRLGVPFEQITFVDDKVSHLQAVSTLGVRCALATWGYNDEREQRIAIQTVFLCCTIEELERLIEGAKV